MTSYGTDTVESASRIGYESASQSEVQKWHEQFSLAEKDLERVCPRNVMLEDKTIAGFLKTDQSVGGMRRVRSILIGLGIALVAVAIGATGNWDLFKHRGKPEAQPMLKPLEIQLAAVLPDYAADLQSINHAFANANNTTAYMELEAMHGRLSVDTAQGLDPLRERVYTELVVLTRQNNKPFAEAKIWYDELVLLARNHGPGQLKSPDFRAMETFALLAEQDGRQSELLLELLNTIREEYGSKMKLNKSLLHAEAESHMAALPMRLHTQPEFNDHWRAIFNAVKEYGEISDDGNEAYMDLRLKMWNVMYYCFRWPRLGEERSFVIDKATYTMKDVLDEIRKLEEKRAKIRNLPGKN